MRTASELFSHLSSSLGVLALAAACTSGCNKESGPAPAPAPSAAEQAKAAQEAKIAKAVAEKRAKREAEEKAAAELKAKTQAAVDALLVAPDKIPRKLRKLPKACAQLTKTYDAFMHRLYSGKVIDEWDGGAKKMPLNMTKTKCLQGNVKVALCQIHALKNATPDLKKQAPAIFRGCFDKYGEKK